MRLFTFFSCDHSMPSLRSLFSIPKQKSYLQSTPDQRYTDWPIVRVRIYNRGRIAIKSHQPALLPQDRAVQIRARDAEERQICDRERQLENHQKPDDARETP